MYTTISDCWEAIEDCKSLNSLYHTIDGLPGWSGDWIVSAVNGIVAISNEYHDESESRYITEERELDIQAPDLIINSEDVFIDMKTGDLEISRELFDSFEMDRYMRVFFADEAMAGVCLYIMKAEDDDTIYLEYIGEAGEGD